MKKNLLERLISKYQFGDIERVKWVVENGKLSLSANTPDRNAVVFLSTDAIEIEDGVYCIFLTSQLRSMLAVLDEDITVAAQAHNGKPILLKLSDGSTKASYPLADAMLIPEYAESLKKRPPMDIVVELDGKFIQTFVKAKGALSSVDEFTVVSDGSVTEIVVGYSEGQNTNRITITPTVVEQKEIPPIHFSAGYFKEILIANKEARSAKMYVSKLGLAEIIFDLDDFVVRYYLKQWTR